MVYADYAYYTQTYGGTMPEVEYKRLSRMASAYLDRVTFDRITAGQPEEIMEKVRAACCAVADTYLLNEQGGGIASETNDGVSISYALGVTNAKSENQRLREAVSLYLDNTGLFYRGVY